MTQIDAESDDDAIYTWFVESLAGLGSAEETRPGVIRVALDKRPADLGPDEDTEPEALELFISREELRSVAWSDVDIFDDTDPAVTRKAANPVFAGLDAFSLDTEAAIATTGPEERYLVFYRGRMIPSIRPEAPPIREANG